MAQSPTFSTIGGMDIEKGRTYTSVDLPVVSGGAVINTIKITEAPRIWRKEYNQDGTITKEEGRDKYTKGNFRGVWILIKRSTATYGTGADVNVPVLYKEGEEIKIHADNSYTFIGVCRIEYGEV